MAIMELIDILRAKDKKSEKYLLKEHILETLKRLEQYHEYINNNKEGIKYNKIDEDFFKNLAKALFIHDLGKIDYNFQKKVFDKDEKYPVASDGWKKLKIFLEPIKANKNIRHEILSSLWSILLLDKTEGDKKIRTAILLHHYNEYYLNEKDLMEIILNYKDVEKYLEFIKENKEKLLEGIDGIVRHINENISSGFIKQALIEVQGSINFESLNDVLTGIKEHDDDISELAEFYEINNENPDYDFLVFLGVMRRCDYSASGEVPIEILKSMSEIFKDVDEKIRKKVKKEKLWQTDILEKHKDNGKKLVLIAPTGSGKTEFTLLWAKEMKRKLIYTLPLRVALNDLFIRFRNEKEGYFNKDYVDILHSTSFIEYVDEEKNGKGDDIELKVNSSKMFSSPVILTTPDQVVLTSLNFYGSDKLISLYPTSSVVLDEIQTYNEDMAAIILRTLQIISELKGNTLIITATFPPYFKKFFDELGYNTIDLKDEGIRSNVKNYELKRHKIKFFEDSLFEQVKNDKANEKKELNKEVKKIIDDNKKSKNILIVVNNVNKAIELFKKLEPEDEQRIKDFYLLHSRLLEKEKTNRIKEIKDRLENKETGMVVVATQIVEASVDIDFDILITEVSTIDSQIQRWGRVYRNRESDYEGEPNINIFVGEKDETYLFSWDDIPGNDSKRLLKFLKEDLKIKEIENPKIEKSDDGKAITIAKENNLLIFKLNNKENTVTLEINGRKIYEYILKEENGKLNICDETREHKIDKATGYIYDKKVIQETINVLKKYEKEDTLDYEKERGMIGETFEAQINGKTLRKIYEDKIEEMLDYLKYFTVEKKSEAQRLFRNIAGTQVIAPQLMEDRKLKKFAEIIKDYNKKDWPWRDIIVETEGIKPEDLTDDLINQKKWELKKNLYEYSVNVPIYYIEKYRHKIISHEFKGFNVLKIDDKEDIKENIKYGIDDYLNSIRNIEEFMIGENII